MDQIRAPQNQQSVHVQGLIIIPQDYTQGLITIPRDYTQGLNVVKDTNASVLS